MRPCLKTYPNLIGEIKRNDLSYLTQVLDFVKREMDKDWSVMNVTKMLENPCLNLVTYHENGKLIGFILYNLVIDEMEVLSFGVMKEYRRKGYGFDFLRYIFFIEENIIRIILEVNVNNHKAFNFYKKLGFIAIEKRPSYYANGDDALLLEKRV